MKKLLRIALITIAAYLVLSLLASLALAIAPQWGYEIVTHRAPLLIVEVSTATIEDYTDSGDDEGATMYGMTDDGMYIGYREPHEVGDTVTSLFVYSPLNNWCDDIIEWWDVASWN